MSDRPHGKHVFIDEDEPQALGICDYTGFVHRRIDLVKQYQWRGNSLAWTGFYVGKDYADKPNEQSRPPILPPDPVPVIDPRLMQNQTQTYSNNTLPVISECFYALNTLGNIEDGQLGLSQPQIFSSLKNAYFGGGI